MPKQPQCAEFVAGAGDEALLRQLLALLQAGQNADGGWAFHAGGQSRVEPTCWAVRAIHDSPGFSQQDLSRALDFLMSKQLPDGSWPATGGVDPGSPQSGGRETGSWATSLACGVLAPFLESPKAREIPQAPQIQKAVEAGLRWLCEDYPRDSSPWRKFLKAFQSSKHIVAHNDSYRGWGWTPRTSSWVEPTAFALMALQDALFQQVKPARLAKLISERRALAVGLLYDRMCPGGGWNCGNPRVYGVEGEALVLPTCWALLALRDAPEHPNRALSLAWLQQAFPKIESAASLAIARMTLESYAIPVPEANRSLCDYTAEELAEQGTHVAAWVAIALNAARTWPAAQTTTRVSGPSK